MSESTGKHRKRFLYLLKYGSKITCLIHVPGHSSNENKVFEDFGTKYAKRRHTKYHRKDPVTNIFLENSKITIL